jgi:pimeloyl-ACP methyl ester carboxylesterase
MKLSVASVAVALLGLAFAAAAPAGGGVTLERCPEAADLPARARCGSIEVPLDRANPSLGTTEVAFALVPRRDRSRPSLGTIVPNPGGPGAAVIAGPTSYPDLLAPLLDRRALLLVDPRGTGHSGKLACGAFEAPELITASRAEQLAAIGACGRELGPRAPHYGSAAVADDIEAVRAALGLERIDLWGDSYGTYLMPVYAARHPEHVRSIVLSGAYPIAFDPWGRDRLGAARRAIRLVCARTRACRGEVVLGDIARLAARLREHPVPFTATAGDRHFRARIDEGALAAVVYAGLRAAYYGSIPAAVASARAGDFAALRRLVENDLRLFAAIYFAEPSFSLASNVTTACHDYPRIFSYADAPAARRAAVEQALAALDPREFWPFSPAGWLVAGFEAPDTCIEWPNDPTATSPLPPGAPLPDVPVLVLSGDLDANTPSFAGRQAAAQFARATFVEIPNEGHTPTGSPCATAVALRFIATLEVNPRACAGTGTPPPVAARAPRRAAELPLVRAEATRAERRALALVVATAGDLVEQAGILEIWGSAGGLRGGRYVAAAGGVRLLAVRVVRDARVSGTLALTSRGGLEGTLRPAGPGVPDGRLQVELAPDGSGRATGILDGRHVDLRFG